MNRGSFVARHHKILFYGCWLLLNLIQARFTGLFDDEAYYWVYSKFLNWGYFDHPPMIALLIKMGFAIFHNELGVRLLIVLMSTATLWLLEKLLAKKDDLLFYCIAISMSVLQLGGIIAVPDVPLIFFTVLFFLGYKRFINRQSIPNIFILGVCMALLVYSKYHGVLVILFTIASNPRMMINPRAYFVVGFALLLFSPHLYWQFMHGFPSAQYHLSERIASSYRISFTLDYIFQQLVFVGPLATVVLFWAALRKKPVDATERALKFTTVGFFVFFLLYSFRTRIEANWSFPAFIGLIVLSHQYLVNRTHLRKLVYSLAIITLVITFVGRLYLAGLLPPIRLKDDEFLFNREWTNAITRNANGLPVFFVDSYQRASQYWFYSGRPTYSLNTLDYRRNGFNFWEMEDSLQHKRMYAIYQGKHFTDYRDSFATKKGKFLGRTIEDYFSFARILIVCEKKLEGKKDEVIDMNLLCKTDAISLSRIHPDFDSARVWMSVYEKDVDEPIILPTNLTLKNISSSSQEVSARVKLDLPPGNYVIRFGISSCIEQWPSINSSVGKLEVR